MAKKKAAELAADPPPLTFEEALERLETIVQQLEDGELGLDGALAAYEEGVGHLKRCYEALSSAERKIELLARIDEDGNCETRPFEEQEMSLEDKQQARSRRRSASGEESRSGGQGGAGGSVDDRGSLF